MAEAVCPAFMASRPKYATRFWLTIRFMSSNGHMSLLSSEGERMSAREPEVSICMIGWSEATILEKCSAS